MNDEGRFLAGLEGLSRKFDTSSKPIVTVDVERYQSYLDGLDMTDSEKEEFLQALWQIIVGFVDLGFGVHPLQEVCGKDTRTGTQSAKDAPNAVSSSKSQMKKTNGTSPRGSLEAK